MTLTKAIELPLPWRERAGRGGHCTLMPVSLMSFAQRTRSEARNTRNASGLDLATASAPTTPLAPARLSIMTCWPRALPSKTARLWRIDNHPAVHLSMKVFFVDGETLDCLAISSHLSRFFSVAEFDGLAAAAAEGLAGAVVPGAGTAGVAGRAAFVSGFAAASGFVLGLAETQALTYALR